MRRSLSHFYNLTKNTVLIYFVSGLLYYLIDVLYYIVFQYLLDGNFNHIFDYDYGQPIFETSLDVCINIFRDIAFGFYVYWSTKSIDLVLYIRAWMYGYGILQDFDKFSYLITRSCIQKYDAYTSFDEDSDLESEQEIILNQVDTNDRNEEIKNHCIAANSYGFSDSSM